MENEPREPGQPRPFSLGEVDAAKQLQPRGVERICINGRFLTQRISGVQRFAREMLQAVDACLGAGESAARRPWVLMVPERAADLPPLRHIAVERVGSAPGHAWDQLLRWHCRSNDILVNLANSGPVLRRRSISIIHDAAVYRTPANFTRAYRTFHKVLGWLLARRSVIGTVSQFSRRELASVLGIDDAGIFVVPNSCEHLQSVQPDAAVLGKLRLRPGSYFLTIGSPAPNKNLGTAIAARATLKGHDVPLVVVGAVDGTVFGGGLNKAPPGVIAAGRLSDAEVKALLQHATALVFPSLYEGFGIPPLEAMLTGCPVIASNIPPVVEVCGDAALYFPPTDVQALAACMAMALQQPEQMAQQVARGRERAAAHSWQHSAALLMQAVERLEAA